MKKPISERTWWIIQITTVVLALVIVVGICFAVNSIANAHRQRIEKINAIISNDTIKPKSLLLMTGIPEEFKKDLTKRNNSKETIVYIYEILYDVIYEPVYETIILYPDDYEALKLKAELLDLIVSEKFAYDAYLKEKYPEAFTVWQYLTIDLGLNDYVAAGIMGNIMNECGGNGLNLQTTIYSSNKVHYGICQWNITKDYNPSVKDKPLVGQLEYLGGNIQYIFDTYGGLYKKGFKYEDFCALTSCKEAADAFRIVYERPGPSTKTTRQNNACYAYSVFVRKF